MYYLVSLTTFTFCSLDNNPHLCTTGSCVHEGEDGRKKKNIIVPAVVASIALIFVLICAFVMFLVLRKKKRASKAEGNYQ